MPRRGLAQSFGSVSKQIAEAAKGGAETNIPAFGKFKLKAKAAREGRNPATGATMQIEASKRRPSRLPRRRGMR